MKLYSYDFGTEKFTAYDDMIGGFTVLAVNFCNIINDLKTYISEDVFDP